MGYSSPSVLNLKAPCPDDHRRGKMHISGLNISTSRSDQSSIGLKLLYDGRLVLHITKDQPKDAAARGQQCRVEWTSGKGKNALARIVFHYDRRQMKHLRVKLEQKSQAKFARKGDSCKIDATYPLEEFLSFWISESVLDSTIVFMHVQGEMYGRMVRADVGVEATVTLKSRLQLTPGHFHCQKLRGHPLFDLANTLAFGREKQGQKDPVTEAYMASHWYEATQPRDLLRRGSLTCSISGSMT